MEDVKPNPLVGAIFGAVQDRQVADAARLELLGQVLAELRETNRKLDQVLELGGEALERTKR